MPIRGLTEDEIEAVLQAEAAHDTVKDAAASLGLHPNTYKSRLTRARELGRQLAKSSPIEFPTFPDDDISVHDVIDHLESRYLKRRASHDAHTWFEVKVKENKAIGVLWFGDPHLDDNGTNWPLLRRHATLCRDTEGLYGVNIGDSLNNWIGRLQALYAKQDTSQKTGWMLVEWFMLESGITWLCWILGNHDQWGDFAKVLSQMGSRYGTQKIVCHDWEARFCLAFPNDWKPRIYASHDFKGNSQWNPLHGPMKEGQMGEDADVYVCGHKHNYAMFTWENAKRRLDQEFIRVRGYKEMDDYARRGGFPEQRTGHSVLTVFDPKDQSITSFRDVEKGTQFLKMLRDGQKKEKR